MIADQEPRRRRAENRLSLSGCSIGQGPSWFTHLLQKWREGLVFGRVDLAKALFEDGNVMVNRLLACRSDELREGTYLKLDVIFSGKPTSLILVRFEERCFAYLNRCVHMDRPLDCEEDVILDPTGKYLRCSMHGIVFDPMTGESMSTLCRGESLTALKVLENDGEIWIRDRRIGQRPV